MFEKRVVRGNTYSQYMSKMGEESENLRRSKKTIKKTMRESNSQVNCKLTKKATYTFTKNMEDLEGADIPPVPQGKSFVGAFTTPDVETATNLPARFDATTQTTYVIEKILPDLSMPVYTGIDKETQIYEGESLFDFDYEAEPLIQVLMTRILEESQVEVMEEEELRVMKQRQEYLIKKKKEAKQKVKELENEEKDAYEENLNQKEIFRKVKEEKIEIHQKLVSRVFAKKFLQNSTSASFQILENMGLFVDEEEKEVRDELLPWIYDTTLDLIKGDYEIEQEAQALYVDVETDIRALHGKSVEEEMERRRVQKEEEERILREREERRQANLERKLVIRENRRLYNIQNKIFDDYIAEGDEDNEIMVISNIDALDSGGMKSLGLKGGLIGEFISFLKKIKDLPKLKELEWDDETTWKFFDEFYEKFVKDGWTITIGVDERFERNGLAKFEDFEYNEFDLNYMRTAPTSEEKEDLINFVLAHIQNSYFERLYPQLGKRRERLVAKYEPEPEEEQAEEEQGEEAEEENQDEGEEEHKEEAQDQEEKGDEENKEDVPKETENLEEGDQEQGEEEQMEEIEDLSEEEQFYLTTMESLIRKMIEKESGKNLYKIKTLIILSSIWWKVILKSQKMKLEKKRKMKVRLMMLKMKKENQKKNHLLKKILLL